MNSPKATLCAFVVILWMMTPIVCPPSPACAGVSAAKETPPPQTKLPAPGPEKGGLASLYPGDEGIERDPRVLFVEDFETGRTPGAGASVCCNAAACPKRRNEGESGDMRTLIAFAASCLIGARSLFALDQPAAPVTLASFKPPAYWQYSAPLISPEKREKDPSHAQKDPTVVFHEGKWHVFMTVKLPGRSAIEYCSFDKWENADRSPRTILPVSSSEYYCAPQVFYFAPQRRWYLIYQMGVPGAKKMWVAYSTTEKISEANSWTQARPILDGGDGDRRTVGGLDYWIICDDQRAYLFFTSLDGRMWRMWTKLEDFPKGFDHCEVAMQAKIFEASHTYKLKGTSQYLTIVEENGRRFYKAYLADRLDSRWVPLADTAEKPFAGWTNIRPAPGVQAWADNVSHGELVRDNNDQTMMVDPANLRFVFQGMLDNDKSGKGYGQFSWRIGILTPASAPEKAGQ